MGDHQRFCFRLGDQGCSIATSTQTLEWPWKEADHGPIVYANQIVDYANFEDQLRSLLPELGFRKGVLRRNLALVTIPAGHTPVQRKITLECFTELGFSEVQLAVEPLVLEQSLTRDYQISGGAVLLYLGWRRIDLCFTKNGQLLRSLNLTMDEHWWQHVDGTGTTQELLRVGLAGGLQAVSFSNTVPLLVYGERSRDLTENTTWLGQLLPRVILVPDAINRILDELSDLQKS